MRETLTILLSTVLALTLMDANAKYIPYQEKAVQNITPEQYDQNNDSYITADEVEMELREDAVSKAITTYQYGSSDKASKLIRDMEDSIEQDAAVIIDILDKDGDELVEPEEQDSYK